MSQSRTQKINVTEILNKKNEFVIEEGESDSFRPPGHTIQTILVEKCIPLGEFALKVSLSADEIHDLLIGNHKINTELANSLSDTLGGSSHFWLKREEQYREALRRLAKALETPLRHSYIDLRNGSENMKYFEALAQLGKENDSSHED